MPQNVICFLVLFSGANSIEVVDGGYHGGVRERVVWPRPPVRAGAKPGDAMAGLLSQARRSSTHTAQYVHQPVP